MRREEKKQGGGRRESRGGRSIGSRVERKGKTAGSTFR